MDNRHPTNLQGLLKFALEYTKSEDARNPSVFEQMDPERKQFLENVLKSMTVDVIQEFVKAIELLNKEDSSVAEKLKTIEVVNEYIENIDMANNFVKLGGSNIIVDFLKSDKPELRSASASLIGGMCQNNPYCQKHFLDENVLPTFIELLNDEPKVAYSGMHAVSCLVRNFEPGVTAFVELGGLECILGCLQSPLEKIGIKATFLISTLSAEFSSIKAEFIKLGAIEKLSEHVKPVDEYDTRLETTLSALNVLMENETNLPSTTKLDEKLQNLIKTCAGKPELEEILEYSQNLKKLLNKNSNKTER